VILTGKTLIDGIIRIVILFFHSGFPEDTGILIDFLPEILPFSTATKSRADTPIII
jgi:hypothetical protein